MFTATLSFDRDPEVGVPPELDPIHELLAAWYKNGQIYDHWKFAEARGALLVTLSIPERTSLSDENNNRWVEAAITKLSNSEWSAPRVTGIQADPSGTRTCGCVDGCPSLVLYVEYLESSSPLRCGECFGSLPLYRLPPTSGGEYWDLHDWAGSYGAVLELHMGGPAESWADAELASADSELSLLGRKVAQRVQDVAGVRTFYYLLQSYSEPGAERCPECDSGWRCEPAWHGRFEYRCDDCLLLADIGAIDASARSPTQA